MRSKLVVILPLGAVVDAAGRWVLPAKLVDGMAAFAREWPGEVLALMQRMDTPSNNLDNRAWAPHELPARFAIVDFAKLGTHWNPELDDAVVLAFPDHQLHGLVRACRQRGVPCVLYTELSLRTQLQILFAEKTAWPARARTAAWLLLNHLRTRSSISQAAAVQCNGTPSYEACAKLNPNALLYFDTRTTADMLASPADIDTRLAQRAEGQPLRLLFSGRLVAIKGVDQLVDMAGHLRQAGLPFELLIAGDGPLRPAIEARARGAGLEGVLRCVGVLDFKTELLPLLRERIDLFVCPHLQGDPSCTYLETMSAGVPIVGYDNEAFRGLHRISGVGWQVRSGRPDLLAEAVLRVAAQPELLRAHSMAAREFAAKHVFEGEFRRRIEQLKSFRAAAPSPSAAAAAVADAP